MTQSVVTSVPFARVHQHNPVDIYWWCRQQYGDMGEGWWRSNERQQYDFYRPADATLFLLRWS